MKTIVGTGILGLPAVMMNFGLVIGITIFIIVFFVTEYTCLLLLKSKNICKHSNFCSIGKEAIGPKIKVVTNIIIIINNIGTVMAELIIFGTAAINIVIHMCIYI
jgi:sodium-coupled neutral amino acid transporter 2